MPVATTPPRKPNFHAGTHTQKANRWPIQRPRGRKLNLYLGEIKKSEGLVKEILVFGKNNDRS